MPIYIHSHSQISAALELIYDAQKMHPSTHLTKQPHQVIMYLQREGHHDTNAPNHVEKNLTVVNVIQRFA